MRSFLRGFIFLGLMMGAILVAGLLCVGGSAILNHPHVPAAVMRNWQVSWFIFGGLEILLLVFIIKMLVHSLKKEA